MSIIELSDIASFCRREARDLSKETTNYLLELPDALHADIKTAAAITPGKTMKDLMIEVLQREYGGTIEKLRKGGGDRERRVLD